MSGAFLVLGFVVAYAVLYCLLPSEVFSYVEKLLYLLMGATIVLHVSKYQREESDSQKGREYSQSR